MTGPTISYRRFAAAWHHILWNAEYGTQLAFRLVDRDFCSAVDDILCSDQLIFDSADGDVRAWNGCRSLPFFHPDGPTQAQVKAVQKARVIVFRTDAYPPIGALVAHAASGTKLALAHHDWWTVDIDVPAEVPEMAFLAEMPCACNAESPPEVKIAHAATSVTIDLDLMGASSLSLPRCHLFSRWWSSSVEQLRLSLSGPLAVMKAAPRLLLTNLRPSDRKRLHVTMVMHDVVLSKLDHRWVDKEFEMLGVKHFEVFSVDRRTGAVLDEKHRCYEFEWAWLDWYAEAMHTTEEQAEEQTYVAPRRRNPDKPAPATKTGGHYLPPGKRKQAEESEKLAALIAQGTQCQPDPKPLANPNPVPCSEPEYVPPWRHPGFVVSSYLPTPEPEDEHPDPEDEHPDMPDHYPQVPVALGGAHYGLGNCRFVLSAEIVKEAQLMDERHRPLDQGIEVALWEKNHGIKSSGAWSKASNGAPLNPDEIVIDDIADATVLDNHFSQSPEDPDENNNGHATGEEQEKSKAARRKLQRMKSWASISSDSGASVIPIDL